MNRKNLTAAVLAGLAGAVGIAGNAAAHGTMHINPDGTGEVLLYPYYSTNAGNSTLLSVVNTTDAAKAVKVRFKEGENSREVLDFNLYLSPYDVWTAALADSADFTDGAVVGVPHMFTADNSCTVPYLYEEASTAPGLQTFLDYDYTGKRADGGSSGIARAAEGHFEMIEMGELESVSSTDLKDYTHPWYKSTKNPDGVLPYDFATAVTHVLDDDDMAVPADCQFLVDAWSVINNVAGFWLGGGKEGVSASDEDSLVDGVGGGLFGNAAVINVGDGTMFGYEGIAVGGFDTHGTLHVAPGSSDPDLNDGDVTDAIAFSGGATLEASYTRSIDAMSFLFQHKAVMNEYVVDPGINAASEWIFTFPTKNWYVDEELEEEAGTISVFTNNSADAACEFDTSDEGYGDVWVDSDDDGEITDADNCGPLTGQWKVFATNGTLGSVGGFDINIQASDVSCAADPTGNVADLNDGFPKPVDVGCIVEEDDDFEIYYGPEPFTSTFDGEACEPVRLAIWDRNESPERDLVISKPPIVSPPPPVGTVPPGTAFTLCYETSVLKFGSGDDILGSSNVHEVDDDDIATAGWARVGFDLPKVDSKGKVVAPYLHVDSLGYVGLPVTGMWVSRYTNGFAFGDDVIANYAGAFWHKYERGCDANYSKSGECNDQTQVAQ